ncbi:glycosyltransferase family 2 protein [Caulobacter sp. S45]|uniref:glycosyltransferase family 2 protein n=1 Tax=Caulobacter sp. S45 TaxID=1641861 RepID=UPI001576399E|nr:glycosyltransferase family 2 protein [Caulobacter sp. S45]
MTLATIGLGGSDALVVIPCLNEEAHLQSLLSSLLKDPAAQEARIVVADGGSTDESRAIVRALSVEHPRVALLENPRRTQSAGVNLAVRTHGAGKTWLIRIDAHAGYPERYISALIETGLATDADSVVVPMITQGRGVFQAAVAVAQNSVLGTGGAAHRRLSGGGWVDHGHHALFRLDAFVGAGGYDEGFPANEDAELDVRIMQRGGRIWLADPLAITYHPRQSLRRLFKQYYRYGQGRAKTLRRHRVRPKLRQILPVAVAPSVCLAAFSSVSGLAALPAALWVIGCLGFGVALAVRERSFPMALSGVAAITMHLGWSMGFWTRILQPPAAFAGWEGPSLQVASRESRKTLP